MLYKTDVLSFQDVLPDDTKPLMASALPSLTDDAKGAFAKLSLINSMSNRYFSNVELFIQLMNALPSVLDPTLRTGMLEGVGNTLTEIGVLASQIFSPDVYLTPAARDIIDNKVIIPTIRLRGIVSDLRAAYDYKSQSLDKAVEMIDRLLDAIDISTIEADSDAFYIAVNRDWSN